MRAMWIEAFALLFCLMNVLMIDVGGTNVKLMASGHEGRRKVQSGKTLTAGQMAKEVLKATEDWEYEAISLGFPGLVSDARPAKEPINLGGGWVNFDYQKAFGKPVRFINDAAMQALASYTSGRMLFLGFGTSIGATIIADDVILPFEIGTLRLTRSARFLDRLCKEAYKRDGRKRWLSSAYEVIALMRSIPELRPKVNLIVWNPGPEIDFKEPEPGDVAAFQWRLREAGYRTYIRRPRGRDIYAACGQLKRTVEKEPQLVTIGV